MHIEHHNVAPFKVKDIIEKELPFVRAFNSEGLIKSAQECYQYYERHAANMPFVVMNEKEALSLGIGFLDYAEVLMEATKRMVSDPELFRTYMATDTLSPQQLETMRVLAKNSLHNKDQALYGRFDAAFNLDGTLKGIYEYNGDTPTMLFESANIQNMLTDRLFAKGTTMADQYNDIWGDIQENLGQTVKGEKVVVLCTLEAIEDLATGETLAQIFEESGADVRLASIEDLRVTNCEVGWEFSLLSEPSFRMSKAFVLLPWEEMLTLGHDFLMDQQRWAQNLQFFEPAWKWVMGHKGLSVYLTDVEKGMHPPLEARCLVPLLKTSFSPLNGVRHVSKPVLGQRSMNVRVHDADGLVEEAIPGPFGGDVLVYQEYCEPAVTPLGKLVVCGWTTFNKDLKADISTIAFRAFDADLKILDQVNERIIPHIVY